MHAMNIDFIKAQHAYRTERVTTEYRRANNPTSRLRARKMVAAIAKLVGVNISCVTTQPVVTGQVPTATTSVQVLAR